MWSAVGLFISVPVAENIYPHRDDAAEPCLFILYSTPQAGLFLFCRFTLAEFRAVFPPFAITFTANAHNMRPIAVTLRRVGAAVGAVNRYFSLSWRLWRPTPEPGVSNLPRTEGRRWGGARLRKNKTPSLAGQCDYDAMVRGKVADALAESRETALQ